MDATDEHMGRIWDRVDGGRVMLDCEHCTLEQATARLKEQVAALTLAEMGARDEAAALALQVTELRTLMWDTFAWINDMVNLWPKELEGADLDALEGRARALGLPQ